MPIAEEKEEVDPEDPSDEDDSQQDDSERQPPDDESLLQHSFADGSEEEKVEEGEGEEDGRISIDCLTFTEDTEYEPSDEDSNDHYLVSNLLLEDEPGPKHMFPNAQLAGMGAGLPSAALAVANVDPGRVRRDNSLAHLAAAHNAVPPLVPGPPSAVVIPVAAVTFLPYRENRIRIVRGGVANWEFPVAVHPLEQQWADASPNERPPLERMFSTDINPYTNMTFLAGARRAVRLVEQAMATNICWKGLNNDNLKRGGGNKRYQDYFRVATIAAAIHRGVYGYDHNMSDTPSIGSVPIFYQDNDGEIIFYERHCIRLLDYVVNWVLPKQYTVKRQNIVDCNVRVAERSIKDHRRCKHPMWSNEWANSFTPTSDHKPCTRGHHYEWALCFDVWVKGFRDNVSSERTYMSTNQGNILFKGNETHRLYQE